jgi:aminomethyltransferase
MGLEWLVALEKGHFNGRRALLEEKARGSRRRLMAIEIAGKKPAHGSLLYDDETSWRQVGEIKSALWSPTCKRNIALAMIDAPHFTNLKEFWVDIYLHRELMWERRMERAWPVERPFFAPDRRKATPAPDR